MSVKIRLARRGRKKQAIYDVVVADARARNLQPEHKSRFHQHQQ
jgi:ribosomal protein S16